MSGPTSTLIGVLREGVALVQMIVFKEIRELLRQKRSGTDEQTIAMLAGAMTNELFGTPNPEPRFARFRAEQAALIESELAEVAATLPHLRACLTDALRIQTLCDKQEGLDDSGVLETAARLGLLARERNLPLPSSFMTLVRGLGDEHGLVVPPLTVSPEDDDSLSH